MSLEANNEDASCEALRKKGEECQKSVEARVRELHEIGQRCAALLREGPSAVEHGDFLYDEHGLPK